MRQEYLHYAFWLLIIGSWVLGITYGRWGGGNPGVFTDIGETVSIPRPDQLTWWHPLVYFTLTVIATFVLSQLFFGAGAAVFLFARGVYDGGLILNLEAMLSQPLTSISSVELWTIFFIMLVLTVNLPLCLWAAHLGTQRATRMWHRLRGKPVKPAPGGGPIPGLLMALTASLLVGMVGTFAIAYA